jgi:cobalamin-dependent methionine synthase I
MDKQLKFDEGDNYIVDMAMSPEEFYDMVLEPYSELNKSRQAQAEREAAEAKAAEEAAKQAKKDEQDERSGLPPQRGTSKVKSNTGDEMLDALIDEMNKE